MTRKSFFASLFAVPAAMFAGTKTQAGRLAISRPIYGSLGIASAGTSTLKITQDKPNSYTMDIKMTINGRPPAEALSQLEHIRVLAKENGAGDGYQYRGLTGSY